MLSRLGREAILGLARPPGENCVSKKVPVSMRIEEDAVERLRNAVWHLGRGLTVTSVVEEAVVKALRDLEKHNGGKPFPARKTPLPKAPRTGR